LTVDPSSVILTIRSVFVCVAASAKRGFIVMIVRGSRFQKLFCYTVSIWCPV
jgi:hypothetical protein